MKDSNHGQLSDYEELLINEAREAVRYFDNGDPMRDVLDDYSDVENIICLFVDMLDNETQVPPEQR